jgi:23S rRNA (pseudouridine1915-N3)-methyltransferase
MANREIDDGVRLGLGMARIVVHLHGRAKDRSARALIEDYAGRIKGRGISVDEHSGKAISAFEYEAALVSASGELILLDEGGESLSSRDFSALVEGIGLAGQTVNLAIGPSDGFSDEIKGAAKRLISLSTLTTTHELAAVLLLEQLYRATEINRNSPYHRD